MCASPLEQKMIFVVGNSRSGTTMMGRVLGNIPAVFTFHELHFFEYLWDPGSKRLLSREEQLHLAARLISIQRDGYLQQGDITPYLDEAAHQVDGLPDSVLPPGVFAAFMKYEAGLHNRAIPCDQTPRNVLFLEQIFSLYPNAYVINMLRDPRDVLLSQKNKWKRRSLAQNRNIPFFESVRSWTNYHPVTISLLWNTNVQAAEKFKGHPRLFQMQFESFMREPDAWMQRICSWLGLDYSSDYLLVPQVGSSHGKDNPHARGIKSEMAGRWQSAQPRDRADLVISEKLCRQNMELRGYSVGPVHAFPLTVLWLWLTWPVKTGLALLFNLGRSRNIFASIARRLKLS